MSVPAVLAIFELCPDCNGCGVLVQREGTFAVYVVVCEDCRTYLHAEAPSIVLAVEAWNTNAVLGESGCWPKWLALLPHESEQDTRIEQVQPDARDPDMTAYKEYDGFVKPVPIDNTKTAPEATSAKKQ